MAIAYDTVATGQNDNTLSLTINFTIANNSNRLLVVAVGSEDLTGTVDTVSSITWNGTGLTKIDSININSGENHELWYLLNPAAGTYNLVVTLTATPTNGGIGAAAISLYNVAQQAPEATNKGSGTNSPRTVSVTTLTNGAWIVDTMFDVGSTVTLAVNNGQTERYNFNNPGVLKLGGSTLAVASAGATTVGWTTTGSGGSSIIAAAFAPSVESTNVTVTPSVITLISNPLIARSMIWVPLLYNRFKANILKGLFDVNASGSHDIKIALLNSSYSFNVDHNIFSQISQFEISGTGYTTGGKSLTNFSVNSYSTENRAYFDADDVTWTNSTLTARYAILYDNTLINKDLICCIDLQENKSSNEGNFSFVWHEKGLINSG